MLERPYDPSSPEPALRDATVWAEQKLQELQVRFENTYPWRKQSG